MSHPFERMFERALKKCTPDENFVLKEAAKLLAKGYRSEEVCSVLQRLERSLIDDQDAERIREAREEVCEKEGFDDEVN